MVARGEVEPDIVELAILSHTRSPQARPEGLPPVRTAFLEPEVQLESEPESRTEQTALTVEDVRVARAKPKSSVSKSGLWISRLLLLMAVCVSFFTYIIAAFVIGVLESISPHQHSCLLVFFPVVFGDQFQRSTLVSWALATVFSVMLEVLELRASNIIESCE